MATGATLVKRSFRRDFGAATGTALLCFVAAWLSALIPLNVAFHDPKSVVMQFAVMVLGSLLTGVVSAVVLATALVRNGQLSIRQGNSVSAIDARPISLFAQASSMDGA